jgi:hypothetical protein
LLDKALLLAIPYNPPGVIGGPGLSVERPGPLPGTARQEINMSKKEKEAATSRVGQQLHGDTKVDLASLLSQTKTPFTEFDVWLIGNTPLIVHAWSEKARKEMLSKQVKAVKAQGKDARDPKQDFVDSLYSLDDGTYGFPVTGVKNCILSAAHKDKGIPRDTVMRSLWLNAQMVRIRPAMAGAVCDMPLVRIYGTEPEMREDMVKIGAGLTKTANLAYRAQFTIWGLNVTGRYNSSVLSAEKIGFLIQESGMAAGLGEWRNERKGMFGQFHIADPEEQVEWNNYRDGKGPMPVPEAYQTPVAAE